MKKKTGCLRVFIACLQMAALSVYVTSLLDHLTYHTSQRTPHLSPCRTQRLVSAPRQAATATVWNCVYNRATLVTSPSVNCICAEVYGLCCYGGLLALWIVCVLLTLHSPVVTICTAQWSLYVLSSGHYMYRTVVTIHIAQWSLYVLSSGHYMYRTVVTICTAQLSLYVPPV